MNDYYENPNIKKEFRDEAIRSMEGLQPPLTGEQIIRKLKGGKIVDICADNTDTEMLRKIMDTQNASATVGGKCYSTIGQGSTAGNLQFKTPGATVRKATAFEMWLKDMTDIINSFEEIERILDAIQNRINPMPQNPSDNKEEPFETTDHLTCMNRAIKNLAESRDSIRKKVVDISEFI